MSAGRLAHACRADQAMQLKNVPHLQVVLARPCASCFAFQHDGQHRGAAAQEIFACAKRSATPSTAKAWSSRSSVRVRASCTRSAFPRSSAALTTAPRATPTIGEGQAAHDGSRLSRRLRGRHLRLSRAQSDGSDDRLSARDRYQGQPALHAVRCDARRGARRQGRARASTWGSFSVNDVSASTPAYWKFLPTT